MLEFYTKIAYNKYIVKKEEVLYEKASYRAAFGGGGNPLTAQGKAF